LFLSVAAELAAPGGQLVSITPRSFAAGRYFRAFRHHFFQLMNLRTVHLFTSRREAFERDSVLQETVIMRVAREVPQPLVVVTESAGIRDIASRRTDARPMQEVLNRATKEWMLYLPSGEEEKDIIHLFRQWPDTLASLGLRISTGPVVAFRTREHLQPTSTGTDSDQAPLFWMHNVLPMKLSWPDPKPAKEQYIRVAPETRATLRPNKTCVLLRRFSAKDDKSRLVAAPYLAPGPYGTPFVGFENKLNYLYRAEGLMAESEAVGLAALLNSRLFDAYFRTFNGNTNVSATELRDMPLPSLATIRAVGERLLANTGAEADPLIHEILAVDAVSYE
jgi:adenine-specific DNA-methyltransferase